MSLDLCQKSIVFQTTNIFENSQLHFAFDYCENIKDGRGYTSGIIGFTTGTHDAFQVIQAYLESPDHGNEFEKFIERLGNLDAFEENKGSTRGLRRYCYAWAKAAANPAFRKAQIDKLEELYFGPSQKMANELGLTLPVSLGQFYDCAIQHGVEGNDSLADVIKNIKAIPPSLGGDEVQWITEFLQTRKQVLCNPRDKNTKQAWCKSKTRIDSYMYMLQKNPSFTQSAVILNNDGKEMNVICNENLEQQFLPSKRKGFWLFDFFDFFNFFGL